MGLVVSGIIGVGTSLLYAYILYWLDRYEKEPLLLLGGVFLWGAIVAAGSAFLVNTTLGLGVFMFTGSEMATDIATGSIIAPLVEETLKGLAVLIVFLIFRREFEWCWMASSMPGSQHWALPLLKIPTTFTPMATRRVDGPALAS